MEAGETSEADARQEPAKKKKKNSIPTEEVIDALSRFENRIAQFDTDGNWRSDKSLWSELAAELTKKLPIKNTDKIRKYLYTMWHRKSSKVRCKFINDPHDDDNQETNLENLSSIPSYTRIETRSHATNSSSANMKGKELIQSHLIEFSYDEWRHMYKKGRMDSKEHHMDPIWCTLFYEKLIESKLITCSIAFQYKKLRQKFSRKYNTSLFKCTARCQKKHCPVKIRMMMDRPIITGRNVVFRVQITGTSKHDDIATSRPLKGIRREEMAEAAIRDGVLATYESNLANADENLLREQNRTGVHTIDVVKTAVQQKKQATYLHPSLITEVETLMYSYQAADESSNEKNKGFIHALQLWPFAVVFFTEQQLMRFARYSTSTAYSYIFVDATGSVVKAVPEQKKPYLYLICFKEDQDASELIPLSGALLTDHTTASISSWLSIVRRGIAYAKGHFVRPSFIVIDFSPALLNAILLSFNETNINVYLRWCFNVIQKKYTLEQLCSMSVIRFCCAHVMHAFTRSISKIKLQKDIRRKATMLFSLLLNGNHFEQIFTLIECIIHIFGSETNEESENTLDQILSVGNTDLQSDFETFFDERDISAAQHLVENQLAELDDVFLSSAPIIHQSPFTTIARSRIPMLAALINQSKQSKSSGIKNPLYSKELVKVFYKWIAYLPIFTGLMHKYKERYASNSDNDQYTNIFGAGRLSNAPIESFFKILKHSLLQKQTNIRPGEFLLKMHKTITTRLKAVEYGIKKKSSKKQSRSKENQTDVTCDVETWKPKASTRGLYFRQTIHQLTATHVQSRLKEKLEMRQNNKYDDDDEDSACTSDLVDPDEIVDTRITDQQSNMSIVNIECVQSEVIVDSASSLDERPKTIPPMDQFETFDTNSNDINQFHLDENLEKSEEVIEQPLVVLSRKINDVPYQDAMPSNTVESDIDESTSEMSDSETDDDTDNSNLQPNPVPNPVNPYLYRLETSGPSISYTTIDKMLISYPTYGIKPTVYNGKRYSVTKTCSLDSSLFLLYYTYKSGSEAYRSLFDRAIPVIDKLLTTFDTAETKGWDIARLYWITSHMMESGSHDIIVNVDLFDNANSHALQHLQEIQLYTAVSKCQSSTCPQHTSTRHSKSIAMPELDNRHNRAMHVTSFHEEYHTTCNTTLGPDEPKSYDGFFYKDNKFPNPNGTGTIATYICGLYRLTEPNKFVKIPPFLIVEVGQVKHDPKHDTYIFPSVKQLPFFLILGKERYRLAGAICGEFEHFTATIVRSKGRYSKYDDLSTFGVRLHDGGDDLVETAIYTLENNNN